MPLSILTFELIDSVLEDEQNHPDNIITALGVFYEAMNDWPNRILSAEQYEIELTQFIGKEVNKINLEIMLKTIDSTGAWQAESISGLLNIYKHFSHELTLLQIIEDLKTQIVLASHE